MLIELVVIKLVRVGAGVSPDYTLTIYGNGTVIYEGRDNVKIKGDIEASISEGKIMELLSEFKDSGFFSLEYNDIPAGAQGRPHTIISISMPTETGETITKKITHYHGDKNVPEQLKTLEDKIDEIVDSKKWISDSSETKVIEQEKKFESVEKTDDNKKSKSPKKKNSRKILSIVILLIIIACLFTYFIYPNLISSPSKDNTTPSIDPYKDYYIEEGENLEIINITTLSDVNTTTGEPITYATEFNIGERVWIHHEIANFSILTNKTNNNETCDLLLEIEVKNNSITYHSDNHIRNNIGMGIELWYFDTNEDWPLGIYTIDTVMTDNVNSNTTSETIAFVLKENEI